MKFRSSLLAHQYIDTTAFRDVSSFMENVLRAHAVQVLTVFYMLTIICTLVLAGIELIFFLVADMGLCFEFVMKTALIAC